MRRLKKVEELTVADLQAFPVWQYTNADEDVGETVVRPVERMPVKKLNGRVGARGPSDEQHGYDGDNDSDGGSGE